MTSVGEAIRNLARRLGAAGVATPMLDARLLAEAALNLSHAELILRETDVMAPDGMVRLEAMAARRLAREPVSRILGRREFHWLEFAINRYVLDPRPDSELLVDTVLAALGPGDGAGLRILDLGTGSGCLLISLLAVLPGARGLGVDISEEALACARGNAVRLGVGERAGFVRANWLSGLEGRFDVLVSNPPYIGTDELDRLQPEVARYDPVLALDGGVRGLEPYRAIMKEAGRVMTPGGLVFFEIGAGQGFDVRRLMRGSGVAAARIHADLAGLDRVVGGRFTGNSS